MRRELGRREGGEGRKWKGKGKGGKERRRVNTTNQ
jgi:hypothetical protein